MFKEEIMLKGQIAIVTGASRGIGKAIVLKFAEQGAKVAFNYSSDDKAANQLIEELTKMGAEHLVFKGSVTDKKFVASMIDEIKKKWGGVDILVNNAGIIKDKPLLMLAEEDWDNVLNVHLKGAYFFSKAVISSMMAKKKGSIINISSLSGIFGREYQTNYGAAKAGLLGFTKCLAREVGNYNIRVNAITVGFINTSMTKQLPKDIIAKMTDLIPLKRTGEPEEVANTVLFLASDLSSYMTGATLNLTGGQYM